MVKEMVLFTSAMWRVLGESRVFVTAETLDMDIPVVAATPMMLE